MVIQLLAGFLKMKSNSITLKELFEEVLSRPHLSHHSVRAYRNAFACFVRWLETECEVQIKKDCLSVLNVEVVEAYKEYLLKTQARSTVQLKLRTLKIASERAIQSGATRGLGLSELRVPRLVFRRFRGLTEEQVTLAMSVAEKRPIRDRFLFHLLLGTGLRVSEIRALKTSQIDGRWLRGVQGKADGVRDVPFPKALMPELKLYLKTRDNKDSEYLFTSQKGTQFNPKTIYLIIAKILKEAGVPKDRRTAHTLRHTFALRALEHVGKKEKNPAKAVSIVQQVLGHAYRQTTEQYLIEDEKTIEEALD